MKPTAVYKGEPVSPDSVKFTTDFQGIPIRVDRPRGLMMMGTDKKGVKWSRRYRYDSGYIRKTLGGDGDGLDVFVGPKKTSPHGLWAVQKHEDGSFVRVSRKGDGWELRTKQGIVYRFGGGDCTRMPWMAGSELSFWTT